jgi:hypothetical protein
MVLEILLGVVIAASTFQGGAIQQEIQDNFGSGFENINDQYRVGDFNGDGKPDIAIALYGDEARKGLAGRGVRVINTNPFDAAANGKPIVGTLGGIHCLGLGIVLGYRRPASEIPASDRFYTYDCFSSVDLVAKTGNVPSPDRRLKWKEAPPSLKGDALLLEEENGGTRLLYWTGDTFRGFPQRGGD